jgi:hypothetical protein
MPLKFILYKIALIDIIRRYRIIRLIYLSRVYKRMWI